MIRAFTHNCCDRVKVCTQLWKICICANMSIFHLDFCPREIFDSERLLCCRLNLYEKLFSGEAMFDHPSEQMLLDLS